MIQMQSYPQCELGPLLDFTELRSFRGRANNLSNRAAADVLYEVLTIMVKKGPLSVDGRSHEL